MACLNADRERVVARRPAVAVQRRGVRRSGERARDRRLDRLRERERAVDQPASVGRIARSAPRRPRCEVTVAVVDVASYSCATPGRERAERRRRAERQRQRRGHGAAGALVDDVGQVAGDDRDVGLGALVEAVADTRTFSVYVVSSSSSCGLATRELAGARGDGEDAGVVAAGDAAT